LEQLHRDHPGGFIQPPSDEPPLDAEIADRDLERHKVWLRTKAKLRALMSMNKVGGAPSTKSSGSADGQQQGTPSGGGANQHTRSTPASAGGSAGASGGSMRKAMSKKIGTMSKMLRNDVYY